jgi:thiol-disulfide isomerase/thioredoxin
MQIKYTSKGNKIMAEETKQNSSWIPLLVVGAIIVVGIIVTSKKNSSIADYVDDSGNIVTPSDSSFSKWIGKEASDFTVFDIEGNKHNLSDYRGRNVMVIFWATWCPPCRAEIPHLIELRKQESEANLAMLAISAEEQDTVKDFVKANKLNYTVATLGNTSLPSPFMDIEYIPTSIFIDPNGRIKTVVVQSLNLKQINAILNAKSAVEQK